MVHTKADLAGVLSCWGVQCPDGGRTVALTSGHAVMEMANRGLTILLIAITTVLSLLRKRTEEDVKVLRGRCRSAPTAKKYGMTEAIGSKLNDTLRSGQTRISVTACARTAA